jgi:KUP system potassium uptake protein
VLAATGAEALYADLGHFGRKAIARAWVWIVFPALTITYVGEAAAVVRTPTAATNPFFALIPSWALWPAVLLATLATIIASQAVISGAYTVVHQAAGLGLLPPLRTLHTSRRHFGQIYVPAVNTFLAVAVLVVVLLFRTSSSLASAYGVAVTSTIGVTTVLYLALTWRRHRRLTGGMVAGSLALFLVLVFLLANVPKMFSCSRTCPRYSRAVGSRSASASRYFWSCRRGGRATAVSNPPAMTLRSPSSPTCATCRSDAAHHRTASREPRSS